MHNNKKLGQVCNKLLLAFTCPIAYVSAIFDTTVNFICLYAINKDDDDDDDAVNLTYNIFRPQNSWIKDTFVSSEMRWNAHTAIWDLRY